MTRSPTANGRGGGTTTGAGRGGATVGAARQCVRRRPVGGVRRGGHGVVGHVGVGLGRIARGDGTGRERLRPVTLDGTAQVVHAPLEPFSVTAARGFAADRPPRVGDLGDIGDVSRPGRLSPWSLSSPVPRAPSEGPTSGVRIRARCCRADRPRGGPDARSGDGHRVGFDPLVLGGTSAPSSPTSTGPASTSPTARRFPRVAQNARPGRLTVRRRQRHHRAPPHPRHQREDRHGGDGRPGDLLGDPGRSSHPVVPEQHYARCYRSEVTVALHSGPRRSSTVTFPRPPEPHACEHSPSSSSARCYRS